MAYFVFFALKNANQIRCFLFEIQIYFAFYSKFKFQTHVCIERTFMKYFQWNICCCDWNSRYFDRSKLLTKLLFFYQKFDDRVAVKVSWVKTGITWPGACSNWTFAIKMIPNTCSTRLGCSVKATFFGLLFWENR